MLHWHPISTSCFGDMASKDMPDCHEQHSQRRPWLKDLISLSHEADSRAAHSNLPRQIYETLAHVAT